MVISKKEHSGSRGVAGESPNDQLVHDPMLQQAYNKLAVSEARYRELYEKAPDMYHTLDLDGYFKELNPRHMEYLGYAYEELVGQHFSKIVPESSLDSLNGAFQEMAATGHVKGWELELQRKDSSLMTVEVHAIGFNGPSGQPEEIRCIMRDITERKLLEEQLRQSQKMESLGQLAGGMAHDLNNVLTAVMGYAQLGADALPQDHRVHQDLQSVMSASKSAAALIQQMLAFSRRQKISPRVVNLNDVGQNSEKMLRRLIRADIELATSFAPDLDNILIDPIQVEQLLMNLVINARDAMPIGGTITIKTDNVNLDVGQTSGFSGIVPGRYVMLSIIDDGIGMTAQVIEHIFEPFFTTKEMGQGTGLGLATCHGIVKQNGGDIRVISEPGQGTTLELYFPQAAEPVAEVETVDCTAASTCGSETVLLVEDEPAVLGLAERVLTEEGYHVLKAHDGVEALEIAGQCKDDIQLLLTDVVMPRMNVIDLVRELRFSRPEIKVVYSSGYTDEIVLKQGIANSEIEFLEKPYSPSTLLNKIRQTLDGQPKATTAV